MGPVDAVAASCAVPVLARPVPIGRHRYPDGGMKCATHAGVLCGADLDVAVVLSPMGHQAGRNPVRSLAHRRVRREVALLQREGLAVQLISPGTVDKMGFNMMDRARVGSVMRHAFLGAVAQLDSSTVAVIGGAGASDTPGAVAGGARRPEVPSRRRR